MKVNINCDMGESFGLYRMGDDQGIIPYITQANIACGYHASDPNHMRSTVLLAKQHNVRVGAHFSLPDLPGFGRREMKIEREEMVNIIAYQVGALVAFLEMAEIRLNHLKPHGALYGMAAKQEPIAQAVADVAEHFNVPVFGLAGTLHEKIYTNRGIEFHSEFYADLEYAPDGGLIIAREHKAVESKTAADRCVRAVLEGLVKAIDGSDISVKAETICIHSDTPNAVEVAKAVHQALQNLD